MRENEPVTVEETENAHVHACTFHTSALPCTHREQVVCLPYAGAVPPPVWAHTSAYFRKLTHAGYFWPVDPMDAYQTVVLRLLKAMETDPQPHSANRVTYLCRLVSGLFHDFHKFVVMPRRKMFCQMAAQTGMDIPEEPADDGETPILESSLSEKLSIGEFVPLLDTLPASNERRAVARALVEKLQAFLREAAQRDANPVAQDAVRLVRDYMRADGCIAAICKCRRISRATFYRKWAVCRRYMQETAAGIRL